ncbi:hypothetical protein O181_008587 [Austropuccinia psidii MF-1]|uniref:Oligopeptide transporter n=1 Tax=Austropuccinia psidii MF-1 TaxID=1389203 RepID=A0A9Q3BQ18_9BASI|nr:hypothetical protein [Austropuccinia psidii MF-1]
MSETQLSPIEPEKIQEADFSKQDYPRVVFELSPFPPYDVKCGDPMPVVPPGMPIESQQFTFRAVAVGCLLGSVVQASNMYLGLKTGFTFGASLFGALFGYAILKPLSKSSIPFLGGYFGPKENCTVQTAATASGGLGILFVSGVPALYQLKLLSPEPQQDLRKLILFTMAGAFFGMSFAIPLRKHYILRQKLLFPTASATAIAIHKLHSESNGEGSGKQQVKCLGFVFAGSVSLRVLSQYLPGVFLEITPAFAGVGILTGLNASLSFYLGSLLAWGVIGPILVATNTAFGIQTMPEKYPEIYNYQVLNPSFTTADHPSPRYWLLWPGVLLMIVSSFTELGLNGKKMLSGIFGLAQDAVRSIFKNGKNLKTEEHNSPNNSKDPSQGNLVPNVAWVSLLLSSVVLTCIVMKVESCGDTDINPISTCAKGSQLIIGSVTRSYHSLQSALTVNLLSGMIAGAAANETTDMVGDLKTGHLLGASPACQFYSQLIGSVFSIVLAPSLFVLFSKAYPCIIDLNATTCEFGAPSVGAWRAVAVSVTSRGALPIPKSSGIFAAALAAFGMVLTVVKYKVVPLNKQGFIPNMNAVGLGFIINIPGYASAMALGSIATYFWKKKSPNSYDSTLHLAFELIRPSKNKI